MRLDWLCELVMAPAFHTRAMASASLTVACPYGRGAIGHWCIGPDEIACHARIRAFMRTDAGLRMIEAEVAREVF